MLTYLHNSFLLYIFAYQNKQKQSVRTKAELLAEKGSLPLLIFIYINIVFVTLVYNKTLF